MKKKPFRDGDTFATFRNVVDNAVSEIDKLDNEYVLKTSPTELEQYYIDKVLIEPLILHADDYYIEEQTGTRLDVTHHFDRFTSPGERTIVQATQLNIAIPYEGNSGLWGISASTFSHSGYSELDIRDDVVVFTHTYPDDSADSAKIKSEIEGNVKSLADAVINLKHNVDSHNQTSPQTIKTALERKRKKAEASINAISELGIPLKRKDKPVTFIAPTVRRKKPPQRPKASTEKYSPEPTLDSDEYEHILDVLRSMSLVIERSPASFSTLDEEAIRTHFLLQLNGHYDGDATGETFNAVGKTDILIRVENKNIFIAECKFWRGPKGYNQAIDQLLRYMSWRDTKCALLVFNKTKDSTAVRNKMHEVMESRTEFRKTISHDDSGDSRYILIKDDDPGKEIIITAQLFDIPDEDN